MASKIVLVDTSVLIDYFRKTDKSNSAWIKLFHQGFDFCISAITEYGIYSGATQSQLVFWEDVLKHTEILVFDQLVAKVAVDINNSLKRSANRLILQTFLLQPLQ